MAQAIAADLLRWFQQYGRHDLPWQKNQTPYRVWVSEIMLQQTQVKTVIPYYQRFMQRFPSLKSLAEAGQDEVLHLWTGLGYYARGRNLHRCAQIIQQEYKGRFPRDLEALINLPGIGRSTAGAILTLACRQRHPILDGNVKRVLGRYFMLQGWPGETAALKRYWQHAEAETPQTNCAEYTQAIMDLGATVCTRTKPRCGECPIASGCLSRQMETQHLFPERKKSKAVRREKDTVFLMIENQQGQFLMEQRAQQGLWGGLWIFPQVERTDQIDEYLQRLQFKVQELEKQQPFQHKFSHFDLNIQPVYCRGEQQNGIAETDNFCWYAPCSNKNLGMAAPVKKLLEELTE